MNPTHSINTDHIDSRTIDVAAEPNTPYKSTKKPLQFWLVFCASRPLSVFSCGREHSPHSISINHSTLVGTCISLFLSALELTSVSTALPTIVHELTGADFIWVGSAYSIASAAFMPPAGGLANIFGRRDLMLASIFLFATGSAIAGASQSLNMLIAARSESICPTYPVRWGLCLHALADCPSILIALQGAGGGGIMALTEIIVADLVPLRERGNFGGLLGVVSIDKYCIGRSLEIYTG